jgi:hypothetical protein
VYLAEAGEDKVLEEFAANAAGSDHQYARLGGVSMFPVAFSRASRIPP